MPRPSKHAKDLEVGDEVVFYQSPIIGEKGEVKDVETKDDKGITITYTCDGYKDGEPFTIQYPNRLACVVLDKWR